MQDASREKRRFLNQAVRVAGGDAFEPTFSRASPDQERMGMSKEYHGRESPSKADEIFDLSLQLGKLRPRVAKTKDTLQYLTQVRPPCLQCNIRQGQLSLDKERYVII